MDSNNQQASENHTWTMKEAAKEVGVGLPRLYTKLREQGLFTRLSDSGRHIPTRQAQREGLFRVKGSAFWINGSYRPCPKITVTFSGLTLLQEIADELARGERTADSDKRPGVHDQAHNSTGKSVLGSADTEPRTAGNGSIETRSPAPVQQPSQQRQETSA